jgi:pimeloyl-ACP methyl ester carboxylesterase
LIPGYRRVGTGRPLVCHPGGPGASAAYFGDLGGLADSVELVLVNPRGTADTRRPPDPGAYAVSDYVADLEELRSHLGLETMDLLGHSHGGVVAMAYAAQHPARVDRLVLASTLARFAPEQEAAMVAAMEQHAGAPWYADARAALEAEQAGEFDGDEELSALVLREMPFYFARFGAREEAYLDRMRDELWNGDALGLFNREIFTAFDLRPDLGRVRAPTLVITGEQDFITGPVCARELEQGIGGAELVILPGAGHMMFVEAAAAFRAAVLRFLRDGR